VGLTNRALIQQGLSFLCENAKDLVELCPRHKISVNMHYVKPPLLEKQAEVTTSFCPYAPGIAPLVSFTRIGIPPYAGVAD
jgi:hypothetical protein